MLITGKLCKNKNLQLQDLFVVKLLAFASVPFMLIISWLYVLVHLYA